MVANPEVIMTNAISGKPACITKGLKNGDFGKFNPATCPKRQLTAKATFQELAQDHFRFVGQPARTLLPPCRPVGSTRNYSVV